MTTIGLILTVAMSVLLGGTVEPTESQDTTLPPWPALEGSGTWRRIWPGFNPRE